MTMTIMYLTVAFLLAALAVSGLARIRGLEFAHGGSPVDSAAILLVIGLVIDLVAQLTLGTQGTEAGSIFRSSSMPESDKCQEPPRAVPELARALDRFEALTPHERSELRDQGLATAQCFTWANGFTQFRGALEAVAPGAGR